MRTFIQRSNKFVFSVTIIIIFVSTIWIPSASGLLQQQQATTLGVKITDPARGQQAAIGRNLTLSGTSNYNPTYNCGVFIIVDGIKPYQKTTPIGQAAGGNDYSKWKYTFTPAYTGIIKQGINRITAKLLCQANPVPLTKFYSINVTGTNVPRQHSAITPNNATVVHVSSNNPSSNLLHSRPLINHLSATMHSTGDSSNSNRHHHYHNISTYRGSSSSSDSSDSNRHHHYHNISSHHHGKRSGYAGRYDEGPGGSFGEGPGGNYP